ncbi:MAG: (Fe-S)-binding protein [Chloroflexota bacterium]
MACGTCTAGCPFSHMNEDSDPRRFMRMILLGMREEVLSSPFVHLCNMCGRCSLNCPMGVNIGEIVRVIRGKLLGPGKISPGLQAVVDVSLETGNNMGISREDYVETLEWMEEELQKELDDPSARIPIDKKGARVYYTLNPREVKFFPLTIQAIAKIFHVAGEDWTLSTTNWDCTNYALFSGDDDAGGQILRGVTGRAREMDSQLVTISECGHAYRAASWGWTHWLHEEDRQGLELRSVLHLMVDYVKSGRLRLDPSVNSDPVTYHDPCNLGRKEGIFEEPRFLLQHAVQNFVEMTPNREYNYCCGGGGGLLAMEYGKMRIEKAAVKAEQLRRTGAKIIAVPCHNCHDQLSETSRKYKLKMRVMNVMELVADAIVLPPREGGTR